MANETVLFKRGDSATITSTPVTDGQILFDTSGNGKMYLDNGTDRLEMGGAITVDASLSKTSTNAIQNKAVTGNILNSLAEVSAATQQNTIAGALALKEVNSSLKFLPDYENAINPFSSNITSDTTYTAPYNGIFLVRWWVNGGGNNCYASINGNKVAETPNTGGSIDPIIVSKGDVINFTISNANISNASMFVPFK